MRIATCKKKESPTITFKKEDLFNKKMITKFLLSHDVNFTPTKDNYEQYEAKIKIRDLSPGSRASKSIDKGPADLLNRIQDMYHLMENNSPPSTENLSDQYEKLKNQELAGRIDNIKTPELRSETSFIDNAANPINPREVLMKAIKQHVVPKKNYKVEYEVPSRDPKKSQQQEVFSFVKEEFPVSPQRSERNRTPSRGISPRGISPRSNVENVRKEESFCDENQQMMSPGKKYLDPFNLNEEFLRYLAKFDDLEKKTTDLRTSNNNILNTRSTDNFGEEVTDFNNKRPEMKSTRDSRTKSETYEKKEPSLVIVRTVINKENFDREDFVNSSRQTWGN
jgi:hypothetical protein